MSTFHVACTACETIGPVVADELVSVPNPRAPELVPEMREGAWYQFARRHDPDEGTGCRLVLLTRAQAEAEVPDPTEWAPRPEHGPHPITEGGQMAQRVTCINCRRIDNVQWWTTDGGHGLPFVRCRDCGAVWGPASDDQMRRNALAVAADRDARRGTPSDLIRSGQAFHLPGGTFGGT